MKTLEAGDYASAMSAASAAKGQVASADAESRTLPVRLAGMLPVIGGAVDDELMTTEFDRLRAGSGALSLVKALASTAPGRHLRVYVNDPGFQQVAGSSGLAGDFPANPGDLLAVLSQNQKGSKVDIFQQGTVTAGIAIEPPRGSQTLCQSQTGASDPRAGPLESAKPRADLGLGGIRPACVPRRFAIPDRDAMVHQTHRNPNATPVERSQAGISTRSES